MYKKKLAALAGLSLLVTSLVGVNSPAVAADNVPSTGTSTSGVVDPADIGGSTKVAVQPAPAGPTTWVVPAGVAIPPGGVPAGTVFKGADVPATEALYKAKAGGKNLTMKAPKGKVAPGQKTGTSSFGPSAVYYQYNSGWQYPAASPGADGVMANLTHHQPYKDPGDYHTLAEVTAQSSDGKQAVEIGWTVDQSVNGDLLPHLFVYHWIHGVGQCYNACGFVLWSGRVNSPGDVMPTAGGASVTYNYKILYSGGAWWVGYNGSWVGYFPGTRWSTATPPVTFNTVGLGQGFGEIAASKLKMCTDMGAGVLGAAANTSAARVGSWNLHLVGASAWSVGSLSGPNVSPVTPTNVFNVGALSTGTFRYGGPAWNATGTGPGTIGAC